MKKYPIIIFIILLSLSCKQKQGKIADIKQPSVAEKIANAHGLKKWKNVSEISFTFNIDKDSHFERSWIWKPKTNQVTLINNNDTIHYNRTKIDSTIAKTDSAFINDKYWLLVPFQLVWDLGTTLSEPTKEAAPISKTVMKKITLTDSNNGGYTPGDAYDIYYGDDYIIKEWIFRRGNSQEPTMITTFEDYQDINGIKFALKHKKADNNWNLNFTNVSVNLN